MITRVNKNTKIRDCENKFIVLRLDEPIRLLVIHCKSRDSILYNGGNGIPISELGNIHSLSKEVVSVWVFRWWLPRYEKIYTSDVLGVYILDSLDELESLALLSELER